MNPFHPDELELTHRSRLGAANLRWLGIALAALAVIGIGVVGFLQMQHNRRNASITIGLGDPPAVEPFELQQVSQDYARKVNAQTPFTTLPIPPAAPFRLGGGPVDQARAIDCLAATIYYEAGNEALEGQQAVAQVVLNRVRHPAFPHSVCGVSFQGEERRTGCQFSYTCDGSIARRAPSPSAWEAIRNVARAALGGFVYAPVGTATHYHTDWVLPAWSAKLDKVRAERSHLFFRWAGYWGTPKAFSAAYTGSEPQVLKLSALSTAHRIIDNGLGQINLSKELAKELGLSGGNMTMGDLSSLGALGLPTSGNSITPVTPVAPAEAKIAHSTADQFILKISRDASPDALLARAEALCGARSYCKVLAWADAGAIPRGLDVSDAQLGKMAFSYLRNREAGFEKPLWNCAIFSRPSPRQCIRGTGVAPARIPKPKPGLQAPVFNPDELEKE